MIVSPSSVEFCETEAAQYSAKVRGTDSGARWLSVDPAS